jgi:hypothetical protein
MRVSPARFGLPVERGLVRVVGRSFLVGIVVVVEARREVDQ